MLHAAAVDSDHCAVIEPENNCLNDSPEIVDTMVSVISILIQRGILIALCKSYTPPKCCPNWCSTDHAQQLQSSHGQFYSVTKYLYSLYLDQLFILSFPGVLLAVFAVMGTGLFWRPTADLNFLSQETHLPSQLYKLLLPQWSWR